MEKMKTIDEKKFSNGRQFILIIRIGNQRIYQTIPNRNTTDRSRESPLIEFIEEIPSRSDMKRGFQFNNFDFWSKSCWMDSIENER